MQKLIALAIVLFGLFIYYLIQLFFKYRKAKGINSVLSELKLKGKKIMVSFPDCEIKTREYYEEETSDSLPSRVEMLDSLYDQEQLHKKNKKVVSVLVYKYADPAGKEVVFRSEVIEMPLERLRYILDNRKQTTIYVDESNWNRYYFDLGFLYN